MGRVPNRRGDHPPADDARRYRDADEVAGWEDKDPLPRLRKYLVTRKLWDDDAEAPTRVRFQTDDEGKKSRVTVKSGKVLD